MILTLTAVQYEARCTIPTYLCILCSQSFTLEHYFLGSLFRRYIDRQAVKGIFLALYLHNQVFLIISVANADFYFGPPCSIVTKEDSRCRHTYVYIVHKVSLLITTQQAVYTTDISIAMRQRAFFRRTTGRINYF